MKTFATQIVSMKGYTREQAVIEIMSIDKVDHAEASMRYEKAMQTKKNRSNAMWMSHHYRREGYRHGLEGIPYLPAMADKYKSYTTGYLKGAGERKVNES